MSFTPKFIDNLYLTVGVKTIRVINATVTMGLNAPATCAAVLAQGFDVNTNKMDTFKYSDLTNPSTLCYLKLHMNGEKDAKTLFVGRIVSPTRSADRKPYGAWDNIVLNMVANCGELSSYAVAGYKFWNNKFSQQTSTDAANDLAERAGRQDRDANTAAWLLPDTLKPLGFYMMQSSLNQRTFVKDIPTFVINTISALIETASRGNIKATRVTGKFNPRVSVKRTAVIYPELLQFNEAMSVNEVTNLVVSALGGSDALATAVGVMSGNMFFSVVPRMNGKFDVVMDFPWDKRIAGEILPAELLSVQNTNSLVNPNSLPDAVVVPIRGLDTASGDSFLSTNRVYPDYLQMDRSPAAGKLKVVEIPTWLSHFLANIESDAIDAEAKKKGSEKAPVKKKNTTEKVTKLETTAADRLAKSIYTMQHGGNVSMNISIPWWKLDFMDLVGYVIRVAGTSANAKIARESSLYGRITGAQMVLNSSPDGSTAALSLSLSHVRTKSKQDSMAEPKHAIYDVKDPRLYSG